jgi:hypothetical protein
MKKTPREITIRPVMNGYVVRVGCQELAFSCGPQTLASELAKYLEDPEGVEKQYWKEALHDDRKQERNTPQAERSVAPSPVGTCVAEPRPF